MQPRDKENGVIGANAPLELAGTVKTYRYLDEEEIADEAAGDEEGAQDAEGEG